MSQNEVGSSAAWLGDERFTGVAPMIYIGIYLCACACMSDTEREREGEFQKLGAV